MPRHPSAPDTSDDVTLRASSAAVASGNGATVLVHGNARDGVVWVIVTAVSGTTPTLDVKVQDSPDGVNWTDIPNAFTPQITAAGSHRLVLPAVVGRRLRVVWTVGGTTPSFTFSVVGKVN